MTLAVLTAADGAAWEASLLAELGSGTGAILVSRRCVDVVELLAVAASGQAVAALVDARLRKLDTDVADRLASVDVAVIGVTHEAADAEILTACGICYSVPADAAPAVVCSVVEAAVADRAGAGVSAPDRNFADPAFATGSLHRSPVRTAPEELSRDAATVIAVWGPTGAPGRTLVATHLADELARLGGATTLIDADVYGGVTANVFGLLDESPGLVAACRQAQSRRLDLPGLAALCWQVSPKLRVLTGIARADRWPEIRPGALTQVLEVARHAADFVLFDLGFCLETDEELSFDTIAPRRNGATLAALDAADVVVAVGSADPIGMQRLVRGLDELRSLELEVPIWVVLNRVRRGPVPGDPEQEVADALRRFAGRSPAALLPYDLASTDRALAAGKTLAENAPASPLRAALVELASALSGIPAPTRARRRK